MTPLDLIGQALKKTGVTGVGMTPQSEDVNDAFADLNMMMGQWNRKRWLIYHLIEVSAPASGQTGYGVGPNQPFVTKGRVSGIESAFYRYGGSPDLDTDFSLDFSSDFGPPFTVGAAAVDYPLQVLRSREDYSLIAMKGIQGLPQSVYLDADEPFDTLRIWPAPTSGEIHLIVQDELSAFPDLQTDITLPAEYQEALLYNLIARLRPSYGKMPDPTITALARASLNTVKVANAQIGALQMPAGLPLGNGGRFNIYTGA